HPRGRVRRNLGSGRSVADIWKVLVTSRAAWISSLRTTSTPSPRAADADAVRMAPSRFMPASLLRALSGRRRGPMRDDKTRNRWLLSCEAVDDASNFEPLRRTDGRAADALIRHRNKFGDVRELWIALEHFLSGELGTVSG